MEKTLATQRHKQLIALLIEAREKSGMTQAEFADQIGEYQSFVARMESGQRRIDVVEFLRFSEVLRFDACQMLARL